MKLIIDIDEQHFEILQSAVRNGMGDNSQKIIANGTPLDKALNEISDNINKLKKVSDGNKVYVGINNVFEVIDKYKKKGANE